ncbi:E3 ubiquitin-protein ligase PUB23-like [Phoenix dactylifera]|uniref:U-box domain-containing protein n=1 Tax=Phoenix dactylifera TaxID=42345 RepID=A0A8B7CIL2_PHODC|nr:E3 ubiquitin-protein ligase PUB23-like [Phoenix dactylifera]
MSSSPMHRPVAPLFRPPVSSMDSIEVPQYYICPISLQIMRDPVTAITGITYDRESIERWLFLDNKMTCPVTKQPIPKDSDLTPNHSLRRLIQAWCTANASNGVDRIPTPRAPIDKPGVLELLDNLLVPRLQLDSLRLIAALVSESECNRCCMVQSGAANSLIQLIISCSKNNQINHIEVALSVVRSLRVPPEDLKPLVTDNHDLIESLTWVLRHDSGSHRGIRSATILVLKSIIEAASSSLRARLKLDFFQAVTLAIRDRISQQATKAALHVLLHACSGGRNRTKIIEAGALSEIIELELSFPDKRTTELNLAVLDQLCSCAGGRAELVGHAAGIAVISKRILRVSPVADDWAVRILSSVCKHSATKEVLQEMLWVGAVSKLCFVLQADCSSSVKEKARWVLRSHSGVWKDSPCINFQMLSWYP